MIDAVEELFQVHVDYPRRTLFQIGLGSEDRAVGRPSRPEAEAVVRERRVPLRREHLKNRLLDHAIHRRRNAKLTHSAVRFGDFHALHRLGPIRSCQKLLDDPVAVTPEVLLEPGHAHPVHTGGSAVGNDFRHRPFEVVRVADGLHQPVATCRAFGERVRRERHGPFLAGHWRFTPLLPREGQQQLFLPALGFPPLTVHEFSDLLATPLTPFIAGNRSGLRWRLRLGVSVAPPFGLECLKTLAGLVPSTMPSADF